MKPTIMHQLTTDQTACFYACMAFLGLVSLLGLIIAILQINYKDRE